MSDKQCSSCGGFCGRGGCKRENVKVSKQREALKLALEVLEEINKLSIGENAICLPAEIDTAMDAIREALTEPARKPLTDNELWEMWVESPSDVLRFARAIERAHGIGSD